MGRPRAYVQILPPGPRSATVCKPCDLYDEHTRTEPARTAARTHNRDHHPDTQGAC